MKPLSYANNGHGDQPRGHNQKAPVEASRMNIDQSTWDAIWLASKAPFLAFMTAILRGWYSGKRRWRTRIIEGLLMALATVAILPVIQYMGLDRDMTVFFGVFFGFVGVDTLSEWARKWGDNKVSGGK